jgi:hypothetical protein
LERNWNTVTISLLGLFVHTKRVCKKVNSHVRFRMKNLAADRCQKKRDPPNAKKAPTRM